MNIFIKELVLKFKQSVEIISFSRVSCFYGKMGSGKSSIAKLIDYCLGGDLDYSPALQNEFVSAKLFLSINETPLEIERVRDSNKIIAAFKYNDDDLQLVLPARIADGEVMPDTGIENLSDLIFKLAGVTPPRVRKSKIKEDSKLERLSIRDILWYCYLDQDSFDSSFFNLDLTAHPFRRLKSKNVLRFIIGFHQEKVAELEIEYQEISDERRALEASAKSLINILTEIGFESEQGIEEHIEKLNNELQKSTQNIKIIREEAEQERPSHVVDEFRTKATIIFREIESLEAALGDIESTIRDDQRHLNELKMLTVKLERSAAARAVLSGVDFTACPRCAKYLPVREAQFCPVCGTVESEILTEGDNTVLATDVSDRVKELEDSISRHNIQMNRMNRKLLGLYNEKEELDAKINEQMNRYDSAYLSMALESERKVAEINQNIKDLQNIIKLPKQVSKNQRQADELAVNQKSKFSELKEARKTAEADTKNLRKLENLFLDCLLRSRVDGIKKKDKANIKSPNFLPEIISSGSGELAVASFSNLSSGGKKNLFKACFALAFHRLANEIDALLPNFLIIDSPMKNISERENRDQFEGFANLIYELASDELANYQFIIIDKEFFAPKGDFNIDLFSRHMTPDDDDNPPLISYYRGL